MHLVYPNDCFLVIIVIVIVFICFGDCYCLVVICQRRPKGFSLTITSFCRMSHAKLLIHNPAKKLTMHNE